MTEAEIVLLPRPRRCYWPINNKNHTGTWCDEIAQIPSPSPEHCCAQCVANSSASPSVRDAPPPPTAQAPSRSEADSGHFCPLGRPTAAR